MTSWEPSLDGFVRSEALEPADSIALQLQRSYDDWPLTQPDETLEVRSISLASGRTDVAVFYAYYERQRAREEDQPQAARFLNETIELMTEKTLNARLFCGFTGLDWATEHLSKL